MLYLIKVVHSQIFSWSDLFVVCLSEGDQYRKYHLREQTTGEFNATRTKGKPFTCSYNHVFLPQCSHSIMWHEFCAQ